MGYYGMPYYLSGTLKKKPDIDYKLKYHKKSN